MTDRELLELAAKAVGIDRRLINGVPILTPSGDKIDYIERWNPLTDDGDALRLAVKLGIEIYDHRQYSRVGVRYNDMLECWEHIDGDVYAATRRAIVRAAAEIGKETK